MEHRVDRLEDAVEEIRSSTKSIAESIRTLATLEVKHEETRSGLERAFAVTGDHEVRLRRIEEEMPTIKLIRNWVVAAVIGIISVFALLVVNIIFHSSAFTTTNTTNNYEPQPPKVAPK